MKKGDKLIVEKDGKYYEMTVLAHKKAPTSASSHSTAYKVLDAMEKVALVLSTANRVAKRYRKIKKIGERSALKSATKAPKAKNVRYRTR